MRRAAARPWADRGLVVWLAVGIMLAAPVARAQSRDERAVRAAYVYNLMKYVEWPARQKELTIALAGDASTGDVIGRLLDGRTSDGRTIRVLRTGAADDLAQCSLLYLAGAPGSDVRKVLEKVKRRSVLTVGESEDFAHEGGMVALVNTVDHIRIEVNLEATQAAGIRISSRVLELATIVRGPGKGGD